MKTASMTMLTVFLIIALSCVIAQEFAIHLLYNRCESLNSAYNQLALSKTKIIYIPYAANEPAPAYSQVDPHTKSVTLAVKNKQQPGIKKIADDTTRQLEISAGKRSHTIFSNPEHGLRAYALNHKVDDIDRPASRFSQAKGRPFEVYALFLCNYLSIDRDEKN